MRIRYPVSSNELNDIILEAYAKYVYLLGYDTEYGETTHSGVYDLNENSIKDTHQYMVLTNSKVPPNDVSNNSVPKYMDTVAYKVSLGRGSSMRSSGKNIVGRKPVTKGSTIRPAISSFPNV